MGCEAPVSVVLPDGDVVAVVCGDDRSRRRDAALRAAVSRFAGIDAEAVRIWARCRVCGGAHGSPEAEAGGRPVAVSLSHAGDATVAIASSAAAVGIDAERLDTPRGRVDGAADVLGLDPAVGARAVLARWALAESVLKADGRGLTVDPGAVAESGGVARVGDDPRRYDVMPLDLHTDLAADFDADLAGSKLVISVARERSGTPAASAPPASGRTADRGSSR